MESVSWNRVREAFHRVLSSQEDRSTALTEACGGDDALRAQVEELLAAHREAEAEGGLGACTTGPWNRPDMEVGSRVGPYKLLQEIGEGGCGVVYMAEQEEPVRRRVALKVIKPGMDSRQVIARFEAERQALAMMEHPNIARVLDAGTTDGGLPYFVMELVRGVAITAYCDANNLATTARLELFADVCHAVQHAHQKGVIHRDIKPSNVLVTLHDDRPIPKVIDFGVAKAINQRLTEKTLFTEFRQLVGTPAYMSPEQAGISGLDVDTRSDVYSLGVLLYELLTGTPPFDPRVLREAAYDEVLRLIREVEPPKPSTRISTLGSSMAEVARHRGTEPASLRRLVRGDLDWIVMKALEKDRKRRYDTAGELARDVARHLDDELVLAGPPSTAYRVRKFVRRNRGAVASSGLAAAGVLAGLVLSVTGWVEARAGREEARLAQLAAQDEARRASEAREAELLQKERAEALRVEAEGQRERAETEYARAAAVLRFLEDTFASADPLAAEGMATVTSLESLLDGATARLEAGELAEQPLVEARVRSTLGRTYQNLHVSGYEQAERHLERASAIRLETGSQEDAVRGLLELAELRQLQGEEAAAEELFEQALDRAREHGDGALLRATLVSTGEFLTRCGNTNVEAFGRAEERFRELLELAELQHGPAHPEVTGAMSALAHALILRGEFDEAELLLRDVLERMRELHGEPHANVAYALADLGRLERARGNLAGAEDHLRDAVAMHFRVTDWQSGSPTGTVEDMMELADALVAGGKAGEAAAIYRQVLAGARELFPRPHPLTAFVLRELGWALQRDRDFAGAEQALRESVEMYRSALGEEHQETILAVLRLGILYHALERYDEAEPLLVSGYEEMVGRPGPTREDRLYVRGLIVNLFEQTGRPEEAAVWGAKSPE